MKRILINATQSEELRVAIVDIATQNLLDLLVERQSYITKTGNIYMGKITAIEPSLDACFVNFGSERHGFLPFKEIVPNYLGGTKPTQNSLGGTKPTRSTIKDSLKEGQKVMVQVEKEERGNKGAALTTFISLAGSYLVLMPNNPRAGGISRRVEGGDRDELREILSQLPIPDSMGLIVRTAGVGKAITELQWDLNTLLKQWEAIQKASVDRNPPFLIHQESDILIRAIRDYLREDVTEIWVDDPIIFERIKEHLEQIRPDFIHCLKLYNSAIPLFNRYQIEHQIEAAHQREVRLPSGGSIVIGHTEALVAIDVNSGQATKGKDIEQTAFEINKEAARVIACQLRLRDIGGLVVIDFIDMPSIKHRREVENELRNALKLDKARTQVGVISQRFGLLEMSRQRLRHSLGEATRTICTKCDGWGSLRSVESLALSILRVIEEDAIRPGTAQIQAQLPIDLATFIINEKRGHIISIEKSQNISILIIPNGKLESPHYRIRRVTESELSGIGGAVNKGPSYRLTETEEADALYKKGAQTKTSGEKPAVKGLFTEPTADRAHRKSGPSLVKRLISSLFGTQAESEHVEPSSKANADTGTAASRAPLPKGERRIIDKGQRNQERLHPRNPRNQARRQPNPQGNVDRKITPLATILPVNTNLPATTTTPHAGAGAGAGAGARQRRGMRNSNPGNAQQKRAALAMAQPVVKTPPLNPPDYPQPSLSDMDLENYYQESTRFTPSKASKPTASSVVKPQPVEQKSGSNENPVNNISEVQPAKPSTSTPKIEPTAPPAVAPTPVVIAPENWTPHKIASAPVAKQATETTPLAPSPALEKPVTVVTANEKEQQNQEE